MPNVLAVLSYISKVGAVLKVGKILWNLKTLYVFGKCSGKIFGAVLREHRIPKTEEGQEFLRASAVLMRSGIIDFPDVDENEIANKLEEYAIDIEAA